ncbi:MAG: hypothetical protein ACJ8FS_16545 [Sphingomicrobium sp.]
MIGIQPVFTPPVLTECLNYEIRGSRLWVAVRAVDDYFSITESLLISSRGAVRTLARIPVVGRGQK